MPPSAGPPRAPLAPLAVAFALSQALRADELLRLPLRSQLKEAFAATPSAMATFFFVVGVTWYAKPFLGHWIDAATASASSRRCTIFATASVFAWASLPFCAGDDRLLLLVAVAINAFAVYVSAAAGGHLVAFGRNAGELDALSALRVQATSVASVVAGLLSGVFAARWLGWVSALGAGLSWVMFGRLRRLIAASPRSPRGERGGPRVLLTRPFLSVALLMLAFHLAPGHETLLYYRQTDALLLSDLEIGLLTGLRCVGWLGGAWAFTPLRRRLEGRPLVPLGIVLHGASALLYLGYDSLPAAIVIELAASAVAALSVLPLYELAARVSPRAHEALAFGAMMSLGNLALAISEILGAALSEGLALPYGAVVLIYAASTATSALLTLGVPRGAAAPPRTSLD